MREPNDEGARVEAPKVLRGLSLGSGFGVGAVLLPRIFFYIFELRMVHSVCYFLHSGCLLYVQSTDRSFSAAQMRHRQRGLQKRSFSSQVEANVGRRMQRRYSAKRRREFSAVCLLYERSVRATSTSMQSMLIGISTPAVIRVIYLPGSFLLSYSVFDFSFPFLSFLGRMPD